MLWITEGFIIAALASFGGYIAETQESPNTHKNVSVLLELQRALQEGRIYTESGDFRYRFCAIYQDAQCKSVWVSCMHAQMCLPHECLRQ